MVGTSKDRPQPQAAGEALSASPINSSGVTDAMQQISIPRSIAQTADISDISRSHWDDGRRPPGLRDYATLDAAQLGWAVTAAAGAHDPSRIDPAPRRGITVSDVTYGIADAATGAWLADHGADTATVSMARTADRIALAAYERMGVA